MLRISAKQRFGKYFTNLLNKNLPNRTKRLIFLASLTARINNADSFDIETIYKLNRIMVLAERASAINFPISLSKVIWHGKDASKILSLQPDMCNNNFSLIDYDNVTIKQMVLSVIDGMPSWLEYDEKDTIANDVEQLLNNYDSIFST